MCCKNKPYILVLGVSVYDIIGFADNCYRSHDSNPGRVKVSYGGVCRNIAENMARIGVDTKFISLIGDDEKGKSILEYAKQIQLDMSDSLVVKGESTPTYMAILDDKGEMVSAIVDMKITEKIPTEFIDSKKELIENSTYMVLDPDNPEILEYILTKYEGKTNFVLDPVSAAKVSSVKHLLKYFYMVKPNRHEAEVLCGFEIKTHEDVRRAGKYFLDLGMKHIFISLDSEGMYYNNGVEEGIVKANEVPVVNVTGAGDSCVAGLMYGYMNELSMKETVKHSIAMSVITISHEDTIHPEMGFDKLQQSMNQLQWNEIEF